MLVVQNSCRRNENAVEFKQLTLKTHKHEQPVVQRNWNDQSRAVQTILFTSMLSRDGSWLRRLPT